MTASNFHPSRPWPDSPKLRNTPAFFENCGVFVLTPNMLKFYFVAFRMRMNTIGGELGLTRSRTLPLSSEDSDDDFRSM